MLSVHLYYYQFIPLLRLLWYFWSGDYATRTLSYALPHAVFYIALRVFCGCYISKSFREHLFVQAFVAVMLLQTIPRTAEIADTGARPLLLAVVIVGSGISLAVVATAKCTMWRRAGDREHWSSRFWNHPVKRSVSSQRCQAMSMQFKTLTMLWIIT